MRLIYTKNFVIAFSIFVFVGFITILDVSGNSGPIKDGFFRIFGYSSKAVTSVVVGGKNFFKTLFTIRGLVSENANLQQKINELSFENARLQASKNENSALRRALNFRESSPFSLTPVEVIGLDPLGFGQIVTIDKGESTGLKLNTPIIVAPGILVGKITKVYPHSSEVTLITDPSVVVNGEVSDTGARGLVKGDHGLGLAFDLISQNEVIKTQDMVMTSGLSGDFPRGILIGQVDSIKSSSSELFQKAFVAPAADLRKLRFLYAIQ